MSELELLKFIWPKILVATACGLIVGYERQLKHKTAGIRTHILICVGSCLFTVISVVMGIENHIDPTRIVGQIVTGVGFLCSGIIFKGEDKMNGVTSAAYIWLVASLGVLTGIGYINVALILTVGLITFMLLLEKMENKLKIK